MARALQLALLMFAVNASAVWLEWDRNSETNVAGYRMYWGTQSRTYRNVLDVGQNILGEIRGLVPGVTYFFAVTAYDTDGLESDFSDEVSYTPPNGTNAVVIPRRSEAKRINANRIRIK
jgi:fibronectin type 3 domain-containing protein